jgi:glutaredoxin
LTRPGCHLCEQALLVVRAVCAETGDTFTERDVDADPELRARYTDQVPVIFVDGVQHDFWRVDPVRLRRALS